MSAVTIGIPTTIRAQLDKREKNRDSRIAPPSHSKKTYKGIPMNTKISQPSGEITKFPYRVTTTFWYNPPKYVCFSILETLIPAGNQSRISVFHKSIAKGSNVVKIGVMR